MKEQILELLRQLSQTNDAFKGLELSIKIRELVKKLNEA